MSVAVLGAGAFGTALAIALAKDGRAVTLWGRDAAVMTALATTRRAEALSADLPPALSVDRDLTNATRADMLLLAVPAQALPALLSQLGPLDKPLVACCKGLNLTTGAGPTDVIAGACPNATPLVLTGPSFAADIARGLPTALTLACSDASVARTVQTALSTDALRLYTSTDPKGAELGGALKNVIAIACGVAIGAGLGDSARAALMTRGFAEMCRLAPAFGANPETVMGLSGLGDLALTCTSELSRNFRFGLSLGRAQSFDANLTVEGAATAQAVHDLSRRLGIDMPVCSAVAALLRDELQVSDAMHGLLTRPLKEERS